MAIDGAVWLTLQKTPPDLLQGASLFKSNFVYSNSTTENISNIKLLDSSKYIDQAKLINNIAKRLDIDLPRRLGKDGQIWLTDSELAKFQTGIKIPKAGITSPFPISLPPASLGNGTLGATPPNPFQLQNTTGLRLDQSEINRIITDATIKNVPNTVKQLLRDQLAATNKLSEDAKIIYPIKFYYPDVKIPDDFPDECRFPIIENLVAGGNSATSNYDFVDPTSLPGVMGSATSIEQKTLITVYNEAQRIKYKVQNSIKWNETPTYDKTATYPIVYILDTVSQDNNKNNDYYNSNGFGHGQQIASLIKEMSGIPNDNIKQIDACTVDQKGHCSMTKIIEGLCHASLDAVKNTQRIIVNMSLGTPLPGDFLKNVTRICNKERSVDRIFLWKFYKRELLFTEWCREF